MDALAPLQHFDCAQMALKLKSNLPICHKINKRHKLHQKLKNNLCNVTRDQIKHFNVEIRSHLSILKSDSIRKMSLNNIIAPAKTLKSKNCEGHDRIPQRVLKDGIDILKYPFSILFNQIYLQKKLPEQWLIAKMTPIHKKRLFA